MKIQIDTWRTELDANDEADINAMLKKRLLELLEKDDKVIEVIGRTLIEYTKPLEKFILPVIKNAVTKLLENNVMKVDINVREDD